MANDASKVYFAPKAKIYIASVSAASSKLPDDVVTAIDVVWKELGYVDDTGIELTPATNVDPIPAMQSAVPIKYVVKDASMSIKFVMLEFNTNTVELYFGKAWTTASGLSSLSLDSTPNLLEKALVIEWGDYTEVLDDTTYTVTGNKNRLVIPRGMVSSKDVIKLERNGVQSLGVTYEALDINGTLGTLLTNAA